MTCLTLLVLLPACSRELAPPAYTVSSLGHDFSNTRLVRANAGAEGVSHTTAWSDSARVGDTTFYSKGRVVTTISVFTDSLWSTRPSQPPIALGIPSGPFNLPADSVCSLGYSGTTLNVTASSVLGRLDRMRECGVRAFAMIRRPRLKDAGGRLSVAAARAELDGWPWTGLCSRVKDSTIIAFYIGDDVANEEWGPAPLVTRLAQWDSIAGLIQTRCPGAPVAIRALPTVLEARSNWQSVTTAWAQYAGPRRHGAPEQFFAAQAASARRQRLGLVAGLNLLNGGCGPATQRRCLPGITGSELLGTQPDRYQLSAEEMVYYKTVALSEPYSCASVDWSWGPNFESGFHHRSEIQSASKALGIVARSRPVSSCTQR